MFRFLFRHACPSTARGLDCQAAMLAIAILIASRLDAAAQPEAAATDDAPAVSAIQYQDGFREIYQAWRDAYLRKDFDAWRAATARYRQQEIRNRIVSQKQIFPAAMFDVPLGAPQLAQLNLIDIFVKGPTATAIYFGKLDLGAADGSSVPDSFLVLRFAGEGETWKFDNMRVIKFGGDTEMLRKIRQGDFSFLQSPEFQPSGALPDVADAVAEPDFLAELWVSAIGFKATVQVNEHHRSTVVNNTGRDLLIGGLNRGDNSVTIRIEPDPTADPSIPKRIEVAIYAAGGATQPAERVYHYRIDPESAKPSHSDVITLK